MFIFYVFFRVPNYLTENKMQYENVFFAAFYTTFEIFSYPDG